MAHRLSYRLTSLLLRHHRTTPLATTKPLRHHFTTSSNPLLQHFLRHPQFHPNPSFSIRFLSTRSPRRSGKVDIAAKARQLQHRRLWGYALFFSCFAGFVAVVMSNYQDYLVFYLTPSEVMEKHAENPSKSKFRLGGLVLEGSVAQIPTSPEMQFVVTDLLTDILVKYKGSLPDLFREGHSVVVEGFIKPLQDEVKEKERDLLGKRTLEVTAKARELDCYFSAVEVLAKHDEKYMPQEVAAKIEKNKKLLEEQEKENKAARAATATVSGI